MPDTILPELYRLAGLYYAGKPEINDQDYDNLVIKYKAMGGNPDLLPLDGPPTGFAKARHMTLMGSLDNAFDEAEFHAFCERAATTLGIQTTDLAFYVEPKIDGASLELCYHNGSLVYALTRGNGIAGDVVTANALKIHGVPSKLKNILETQGFLEVRGEVVMFDDDFAKFNAANGGKYKNARNVASGSLRVGSPEELDERPLRFIAHSLGKTPAALASKATWFEAMLALSVMGFDVQASTLVKANKVRPYLEHILASGSPYAVDGVVAKVNSMPQIDELGMGTRTPRWAIAVKRRESGSADTILKSVTIQVGRTGALTPVAELEPVEVGGVTISRATLHNQDEIDRLGLRIGDLVSVRRAGEVIPEIFAVAERRGNELYEMPKICPSCGNTSTRIEGEAVCYCPNELCPERKIQALIHFVGQNGLDIKGLGESVIRKVAAARLCGCLNQKAGAQSDESTPWLGSANLLSLKADDFIKLPSISAGVAKKLETAIMHAVKSADLATFIRSLGIRHAGAGTAKRLSAVFGSMNEIMDASLDDFLSIPDIGYTTAVSLRDFFLEKNNRRDLCNMMSLGLDPKAKEKTSGPLSGKTILFTGTLSMPRKQAEAMAEEAGAIIAGSVNKNLSILVVGIDAGSKLEKARKLHIPIMEEWEFTNACQEKGGE